MIWFIYKRHLDEPGDKVLLKTDWVAIAIATFGVGVVAYYGWPSRDESPVMKKILHTLLLLLAILWGLCTYLVVSANG